MGRLDVITGPMFSGKTTELLRRLQAAQQTGSVVVAVKPRIDTRYHPTDLVAHTGESFPARCIDAPAELLKIEADVIGLDEAHFLRENLIAVIVELLDRGCHVICAGLDRTSFHVPFDEMGRLMCEANTVVKLTARCSVCGEPATHTQRLIDDERDIVIGGEGMFEPRCRTHRLDETPRDDRPS